MVYVQVYDSHSHAALLGGGIWSDILNDYNKSKLIGKLIIAADRFSFFSFVCRAAYIRFIFISQLQCCLYAYR